MFGATTASEKDDDTQSFTSHRFVAKETVGLKDENKSVVFAVNTSRVKEVINPNDVLKVLESDFIEKNSNRLQRRHQCPSTTGNSSISSMMGYTCERTHTTKCLSHSKIRIQ